MEYKVFDKLNCLVKVTDDELDTFLEQKDAELKIEYIRALNIKRDDRFVTVLTRALNSEIKLVRSAALYAIVSLANPKYISVLHERKLSVPLAKTEELLSEGNVLDAGIKLLESGIKGIRDWMLDENASPAQKISIAYIFNANVPVSMEFTEFMIIAIDMYVNKRQVWINSISRDYLEDGIIKYLEGLLRASEETETLQNLSEKYCTILVAAGRKILEMKIDSYAKELIAEFARALPAAVAYDLLEPIMNGKAKGDVKKELNITLNLLQQKNS